MSSASSKDDRSASFPSYGEKSSPERERTTSRVESAEPCCWRHIDVASLHRTLLRCPVCGALVLHVDQALHEQSHVEVA